MDSELRVEPTPPTEENPEAEARSPVEDSPLIQLTWPGKLNPGVLRQRQDGAWELVDADGVRRLRPLVDLDWYPTRTGTLPSLVVVGDKLDALRTIGRGLAGGVKLAYFDLPRLEIDDRTTAFQAAEATMPYSAWLSVVDAHLSALQPLLRRDGVVVVHAGDNEQAYARLIAQKIYGKHNFVGTIIWQRAYGPRNMKGMKEFTSTHDLLFVYAMDKEALPPVGLTEAASGFSNPDEDPRGPWKAEHKGARSRRAKSDFNTYVSPYRWRIVDGSLPAGIWRLSPLTGVIWGVPSELGEFPIVVEVEDSTGATAKKALRLQVRASGVIDMPTAVPWLFEETSSTGKLRVKTTHLPHAALGVEYSAICLAAGGEPFRDGPKRPGSGRYWEFADDTLVRAYLTDSVYMGKDGRAIPHPKTYALEAGEVKITNQQSWWPGRTKSGRDSQTFAGYTEDATKHLKRMQELGLLDEAVTTAKPEHLLARLIDIFSEPNDVVLELSGQSGDLASVALKRGRRFISLSGESERDMRLVERCALPRLRAVVDGKDLDLGETKGEIRMRTDAFIPYEGGGGFASARLGDWLIERAPDEDFPRLNREAVQEAAAAMSLVLTAEGFVPSESDEVDGVSLDGRSAAIVIPPDQFLSPERLAEIVSKTVGDFQRVSVYYFRATDDLDPLALEGPIVLRRVPSELTL